ncbi:MAG: [protein-PII] uridylyltransferase [Immundisolibacteraceae bacterium]|nr:[protein-PII] uridylyltransferase [Immundisolibacteraceae bacterium]
MSPLTDITLYSAETLRRELTENPLTTTLVRDYASELQNQLQQMFDAGETAERISQHRCEIIDTLLQGIWRQTIHDNNLSLVAVGGYGRGELQPGSDIDLLILADNDTQIRESDGEIRGFVTLLWDMGLEVGQSVRTLGQCVSEARKDLTVITALLEIRDLSGKPRVVDLQRVLSPRRLWSSRRFFKAKLEEQQQRHLSFGESSYKLEPNIKESPGGLRDLQTIAWIALRHYGVTSLDELADRGFLDQKELHTLQESRNLLWWIRTGLHLLNGRKDDQLLFHHQRELARIAGYKDGENALAVESFMKSYYRAVMELRRLNEMFMQRLNEEIMIRRRSNRTRRLNDRFQLRRQQLEVVDDQVFVRHPEALIELFLLMARYRTIVTGVNAATIRLVRNHCHLIDDEFRRNNLGSKLFLDLLRAPFGVYEQLRRMHRYGVLGAFLPEFRRVTGQMQHDLFHVYTVDEHTLLCVRNTLRFADSEETDDSSEYHPLYQQLAKPELLILAALTHDIGKGRGGNHSEIGADVAGDFGVQLELSAQDSKIVTWLVGAHLDMSSLSQNADISDPEVIERFAEHVETQERLVYLYLLTVADMQATGPTVWNSWKGSLLKQLFQATRRYLQVDTETHQQDQDPATIQEETLALLPAEKVTAAQARRIWSQLDDDYFQRFTPAEMAWHAKYVVPKLDHDHALVVATRNFPERGGTGLFVYTADRPSLFAVIATELDKQGLDIVDARIITSSNGFALDTFIVLDSNGRPVKARERRRTIRHVIRKALESGSSIPTLPSRRLDRQTKAFRFPAGIHFEPGTTSASRQMELTASNQPGLIATVATILASHYVSILNARINTYGERVQDQFTITLPDLDDTATEALLAELKAEISEALSPDDGQKSAPITMDQQF